MKNLQLSQKRYRDYKIFLEAVSKSQYQKALRLLRHYLSGTHQLENEFDSPIVSFRGFRREKSNSRWLYESMFTGKKYLKEIGCKNSI